MSSPAPAPAPAPIWPPTSSSRTNAASPSPTAANPPITSTPFTKTVSPSPSPFPFPVAPSTSPSSTIPSTSLSPSPSSFPPSLLPAPLYSSNPFPPPTFTTFPAPSSSSRPSLPPPAVTTFPPPSSSNPSPRLPFVTAYPPAPSSSSSVSKSQLPSGRVLGIVVGGVVMLVVLSVLCAVVRSFVSPKKRRRDEESYYSSPSPGPKDNLHNGGQQYQRPQNPPDLKRSQVTAPRSQSTRSLLKPMRPPPPPPPPPPFITFSTGSSGTSNSGPEHPLPQPATSVAVGFPNSTFTYEELARATDGFSDAKLLGQGGFGLVHRGVLGDGKEVAVKQMKTGSRQGEREFQSEVEIISRLHHKHLVSLVGYCISETMRMLVYEFVPNNTLEFHLHGEGRPSMDWPTRMKIALGSAKGLAYLHEDCHPKIIHRDIKAANILLDFKFEAKVADFGLAKFSYDVNTYVSTRVMGTFGYLAPEYASSGKLTDKSDVFSFGVMVLELITGHKPVGFSRSLVDWARPLLTRACDDGNFDSLVDPKLEKEYDHNEMARMVACAAACVRLSAQHRPRMSQIVRALEGDVSLSDLNNATGPGQSNIYSSSHGSLDCDTSHYNEDMEGSRRMASDSQGYGASHESSEPSSEAGSNSFGPSNERPKYSEPSSEGGSNPSCFSNEKPKCSEPSREGGLDHSGSSNEMLKYSEPSSEVGPDHFGSSNEKRKCSELNSDGGSNLSRSGKPSGEGDSNLSSSSKEESNQLENGTEKDEEEVNRNGTEKDEEQK